MSDIMLLISTHGESKPASQANGQALRFSLPEGATLGTFDEHSGRWAPFLAEKSHPRPRTIDWSVLD